MTQNYILYYEIQEKNKSALLKNGSPEIFIAHLIFFHFNYNTEIQY